MSLFLDGYKRPKNKKKEEKKTEEKKPQSSSASRVNERASNSTFMGGGASVKQAQKTSTASTKPKSSNQKTSTTKQSTPQPTKITKQRQATDTGTGRKTTTTRHTPTTKEMLTQRKTDTGTGSKSTYTRRTPTAKEMLEQRKNEENERRRNRDANLNLKQTQAAASRRRAKPILDTVDNAARNLGDKANKWEKENLSARNPMLKTQRAVENQKVAERVSERQQKKFEKPETSKGEQKFLDYTEGVLKRKALGYAKTASKLVQTNEGYEAQGRWAQEDPEFARRISSKGFSKRADKAFEDYAKKQETTQKKLSAIENDASGVGKVALQAYGSGLEMGIDRLAGPLWAASMFASAYGNQRGQALKEGATDEQDARAAFFGAGVEVATEYMFKPVAGIASKFGGKHSLDFAGKLAAKVTSKLTGNKAKLADIAIRTLGSQVEEGLEEVAGWAVNPYAQNFAYKNDLQKKKESDAHAEYNDMQQSFWDQFDTEEEAQQAALHVNSQEFIDDLTETYEASGATKEEASSMARIMQKYFLAHFDNDEKAAEEAEAEMDRFVVGDVREKHSWKELGETLASTFLLTGVTGGASVYYTNQMGNQMLNAPGGADKVKQYTDIVIKYDPDNAKDAKYVKDTLDNGGTPTGTQVYQVANQATEVLQDMGKREAASDQVKQRKMREEDLRVPPVVMSSRGPQFNEETAKAYQASYDKALGVIRGVRKHGTDVGLSEDTLKSSETMRTAAHAVAAYETGTITAEQINDLTIDNPETRTIFELATGVDLSQYNVTKRGKIDEVASNNAMMNGLLANAAENYVQMARAEQKQWSNRTRGRVLNAMSTGFGENGNLAMHDVLKAADPRNQQKYLLTARVAQNVYDYARRTDFTWKKLKNAYKGSFKNIDIDAMKAVYDAAKMDKEKAEMPYLGRKVVAGEAMRFEKSDSGMTPAIGEFTNDSERELTGEEDEALRAVASRLGVNIRIVPDEALAIDKTEKQGKKSADDSVPHFNGSYDSKTNTILLAATNGFNDNILYAMSHETTHLLAQYAPEAYMKLSNYIMDKYYKTTPGMYERAIKEKQALYKRVAGQELSEEEALEEIIADATRDFWADPDFVNQISNDIEDPGFFKSIVNAIRDMLRHIRSLLSSGHFDNQEHEDVLWDILGTYSEAEKLWLNAYTQAVQNKAAVAIDEWQDRANKASISTTDDTRQARITVNDNTPIEDLDQHNATVEDDNGDVVAEFQDNGSVRFSISSFDDKGRSIYKKYLNKMVKTGEMSQQEANDMMNELETVYKICKDFADKVDDKGNPVFAPYTSWSYADVVTDEKGKPVFSAIKKNSEYKMNIDFSTICKKRRTLDAVFREMINRGLMEQLDFNKDESAAMVVNINNLIRQNDFEAACALCFVEARRYRQQQTATTFRDMWNDLVESMYKDKSKIAYFNFGKDSTVEDVPDGIHTMDAKDLDLTHIKEIANARKEDGKLMQTAEAKAARLILKDPSQRKLMRIGDMMASTGFENMQIQNPKLMKIYNAKKGTGGAKSSFGDVQYLNEIINSKTFDRRKAYAVSGVRIQSFSDYVPRMVFDYVQVIADLAAKKLPAHAYTKEVLFAQQFGLTGAKINLSLVPDVVADGVAPGLDAQGNYIWNEEGTFPFDEAMKLQEAEGYKENCGTIAVGISDQQILKMLADPKIQMVIPYHKSSLNPIVAAMTNVDRFENYEKFQTTKDENGNALSKDFDWDNKLFELSHDKDGNQLPKEQWGNVQDLVKEYADWCKEHNYTPKFPQFLYMEDGSINPGYYKLLEDFALLDNKGNFKPQGDVQMRFPTESDEFGSMQSLIEQGLTEDTELEANRTAKIGGIVDRIKEMMDEGTLAEQSTTSEKLASKFSISPEMDEQYMQAVNSGNMDEAQRLVDEAARAAGYDTRAYHGTGANFTVFDKDKSGKNYRGYSKYGKGLYFADSIDQANHWGKNRNVLETYLDLKNPYIVPLVAKDGDILLEEYNKFKTAQDARLKPSKEEPGAFLFEMLNGMTDDKAYTTKFLQNLGYDGIIAEHIAMADMLAWTEYVVFEPEQIKSADPVTYAEDGSVIPLSERFDPNNNDIRYSLPTTDADGNVLTDGQMEYFKNSQARDAEGRLVPVYHTTNKGGFTIFDPMRSDDHRSLFFSDDWDVSQTYGEYANSRFYSYDIDNIDDVKKYLDAYSPDRYFVTQEQFDQAGGWEADMLDFENVTNGEQSDFAKYLDNPDGYIAIIGVPDYSPDNTSYADTWVMAKSPDELVRELHNHFGWQRDNYRMGTQHGYYACYLNLENPMIIDAHGQYWNSISVGELPIEEGSYFDVQRGLNGFNIILNGSDSVEAGKDWFEIGKAINEFFGFDEFAQEGLTVANEILSHFNRSSNDMHFGEDELLELFTDAGVLETHDTRGWAEIAQDEGYDGVIFRNVVDLGGKSDFEGEDEESTVYVAFSSDQVKDINNENPTENPDIRYSIPDENEVKEYVAQTADNIDDIPLSDGVLEQNRQNHITSAATFQNSIVSSWSRRTLNLETKKKTPLKNQLISLMKAVRKDSNTERQYKTETLDETIKSAENMYAFAKKDNAQAFAKEAWDAAERIVDDIDYNDDLYEKYKEMQTFFERNKIAPPSELYADEVYGEFETFKRENDGKIRWATHALQDLQGDETELDVAYRILHREYPMFFTEAYSDNPIDQLMQMAAALNNTDAYRDAYTSEEHAKLVENIANNLCDIVSEGNEYRATIDELKVKAMKQRHEEALRKVREERNAIADSERNRANRWKQKYNDRIQKEKAERNEKADKREHLKSFGHIEKNYNKLCTWVLNPTKEKNVPEEFRKSLADFLQALDLQTENSKKLEAKTGRVAQKTLKMRELKDRLNDLSTRKGDDGTSIWEVDESIAFLLEKLSNKLDETDNTIDALDNDDIATIDVFMQLLIRNIERYKQVKTETKMAELSDIGGRGVTFLRDKIKRDGMFKKKGAIQTINATALTPAYLFDRLGPLKEMYDVLRHNGFDTYIRNEKMIMDRMGEILSGYYKTNKKGELLPGSEAEKWRDDRSAQTIELENGKSITMTAAQMMSLYCLTKRGMQAIGHMCVGGVVVTPIQAGSKIQAAKERIKNKGTEESTEKRVLTINDIQNIISKLTEDQIKVADQLQSLMSNEMAQLGNEAHRELYGYEMFNEDNYFPIKVYGNERSTDINTIGDVIEKIKSFGFTKPLTPNANKALEIDDIFSVVADHCNGMNLYNAYLVPITDFMKVLNYTHTFEDGEVLTMKEAIEQAYGKDMLKYILNLMKDINGIKGENRGGLEGIMNKALGTAKRTAVFGNIRVALQQPTAIVRAAAEINPKYIKGALHADSIKGFVPTVETKTMEEMWKYCPIAQWKAWGYYDTYMGRDIEDVMMNTWSIGDKFLAGYYGQLDNATWSIIWQAVKAEQAEKYPEMDHNSEEFLQICGRRASEVFDKTQVVDSTFHRSDAMRSKQVAVKVFTAFMAEPTLTLNVFRAGLFNANEAKKAGNKAEARKIMAKAIAVIGVQAIVVSAAQAFADAWRGKDPGLPWDDDDDEEKIGYWWRWIHNFTYNLFDQAHLENNMYLVKDVTPYINYMISKGADYADYKLEEGGHEKASDALDILRAIMGWDQDYLYSQNNLVFAGLENTVNGIGQAFKKLEKGDEYVDYNTKEPKSWYDINQKVASGIGTFTGFPAGTLMRDFKPIWDKIIPAVFAADTELMDNIANKMGYQKIGSGSTDKSSSSTSESEGSSYSMTEDDLPDNLTDEQKKDILKAGEKRAKKAESEEEQEQLNYDKMLYDAMKAAAGLEGEEYNKKVYSSVAQGLKGYVADGDYTSIGMMRTVIEQAGGDVAYFDQRVMEETKSAYKKTLVYAGDMYSPEGLEARNNQKAMFRYMMNHGMTQEELSSEVLYHSELAKDMKVAYRVGDNDLIAEAMVPLVDAGITELDLQRLYENRNRMDLTKYKQNGRFKDKLKSMGTFIWPTEGVITSHFGYRNAPTAGASSNHPAIDIGAPTGTPVVAADGGVVISAGANGGYGNSVGIKHDNGMITWYNHLSGWNVKVGDTVGQGQQIAQVGSTGISTGPHLDFKIVDAKGNPVDPEKYLDKRS